MSGEKKHEPTQKKLDDARKEGQIPRSKDVGAWASIAVSVAVIPLVISLALPRLRQVFSEDLPQVAMTGDTQKAVDILYDMIFSMGLALSPLMVLGAIVAFAGNAIQGGVVVSAKPLKPKWEKLNPLKGLKQMFTIKTLWEAAKALIKTAILVGVIWYIVNSQVQLLRNAGTVSLMAIIDLIAAAVFQIVQITVAVGLTLAVIDYIITRKEMRKKLRMSDQDIKDEHKQAEGDPQLKGQIKSRQMQMSRNRMISAAGDASVVIANPTHLSLALRYDDGDAAPKIVAKGQGLVALKIREVAAEAGIPVVQDIPLARALYYACDVDDAVPAELFTAVATVLAFVLRLNDYRPSDGPIEVPGGAPDVPAEWVAAADSPTKKRRRATRRHPAAEDTEKTP